MEQNRYPFMTLFGRTLKFLTQEFELRLEKEKIPLTIVEFVLLYRLSVMNEDEITQKHFAQLEGKHKSVILRQIDGLEIKKLVERNVDAADRRKNNISLTKKGNELLKRVLQIENEMMEAMTTGISEEELEILKKVSLTIQKNALEISDK
jgi:DNA-binding MarR family transcriptional regulator